MRDFTCVFVCVCACVCMCVCVSLCVCFVRVQRFQSSAKHECGVRVLSITACFSNYLDTESAHRRRSHLVARHCTCSYFERRLGSVPSLPVGDWLLSRPAQHC